MKQKNPWRVDLRLDEAGRQLCGPGKIFDQRSYWGNVRAIMFGLAAIYIGWHAYDILAWWDNLWGATPKINPGKQATAQFWSVIMGGGIVLISIACMIMIPINRRRAAKSTKGQWYDDPALTREALHGTPDEPVDRKAGATGDTDRARREEKSS